MEHLERLGKGPHDLSQASWYAIRGGDDDGIERYVVSTPGTRRICNQPELLGLAYTDTLRDSMAMALGQAPFRPQLVEAPETSLCVLHLLRGGLNFGLRAALGQAFGFSRHGSAFMSSQRCVAGGQWGVTEDSYRKLDIPHGAVLLVGDVVATGVTLEHGLEVLRRHMLEIGVAPKAMIFVTIGGPRAEAVLAATHRRWRESFPSFTRSCVVYIEGRFTLAGEQTPLHIREPGTDLLRRDALMAPEFALSQYESLAFPLERCTIYDAGARAFTIPAYVHDVIDYWEQVRALALGGFTLRDALLERWPEGALTDRAGTLTAARAAWVGVDATLLQQYLTARQAFWAEQVGPFGAHAEPLATLCDQRVEILRAAAGLPGATT
ncbi:MAG: hypothetical protein ABIO70_30840 [Pseudomonadota bacterium]